MLLAISGNGWAPAADQIRRIKIILPRNTHQGEERVAPCIGQSRPHPVRRRGVGDGAHRPVGRHPFARGVSQDRGEPDQPCLLVDLGRLDRGDLMPAQRLAHDVKATRERRVAERSVGIARERRADGGAKRLLRVRQFRLRLGERARNRPDRLTGPMHDAPPPP